jgi:hypothetical protein
MTGLHRPWPFWDYTRAWLHEQVVRMWNSVLYLNARKPELIRSFWRIRWIRRSTQWRLNEREAVMQDMENIESFLRNLIYQKSGSFSARSQAHEISGKSWCSCNKICWINTVSQSYLWRDCWRWLRLKSSSRWVNDFRPMRFTFVFDGRLRCLRWTMGVLLMFTNTRNVPERTTSFVSRSPRSMDRNFRNPRRCQHSKPNKLFACECRN